MGLEDDLRESLRFKAERIRPLRDTWSNVRNHDRGRRGRVTSIVVALALAFAAITIVVVAFGSGQPAGRRSPAAQATNPPTLQTVAPAGTEGAVQEIGVVPIDGAPGSIGAAGGLVWVSVVGQDGDPSGVAVLDAQQLRTVDFLDLSTPLEDVVATGGGVYGVTYLGTGPPYHSTLIHVTAPPDLSVEQIDLVHGPLVVDGDGVWAVIGGGSLEGPKQTSLVFVDAASWTITREIELPFEVRDGVLAGGKVWLLDTQGTVLLGVDTTSGSVDRLELPGRYPSTSNLVSDGLRLWISVSANDGTEALEIDGSTGVVTRTFPVPPAAPIVASAEGLWMLDESGVLLYYDLEDERTVVRLDYGRSPAQTAVAPTATFEPVTETVWIADSMHSVTAVDLANGG